MAVQNPLTEAEMTEFLEGFGKAFRQKYEEALRCGAIAEGDLDGARYLLANAVLQIVPETYWRPDIPGWKKFLRNLRKFI